MKYNYTIIIPHYNIPELLVRCINSIPKRDDIQIIVVDDYSDDADTFLEKYPELCGSQIEFYQNILPKGAGNARNMGLMYAKGRWLTFMDADDFLSSDSNYLMDKYLASDADIVYFLMDSVYSDTLEKADRALVYNDKLKKSEQDGDVDSFIFTTNSPVSKFVSRQLVMENGIQFEGIKVSNDAYFSMNCAIHAKKVILDPEHVLYVATKRRGSLDYTVNKEYDDIRMECAYRINNLLYQHGKGKYHRNLFGISNRFIWKWKYVIQYRNIKYFINDALTCICASLRHKINEIWSIMRTLKQ